MNLRHRRSGFTLIELLFAVALLAVVLVKLTIVVKEATEAHGRVEKATAPPWL